MSGNKKLNVDEILKNFRGTTPQPDEGVVSEDKSRERENKRQECIDHLTEWSEKADEQQVKDIQHRLFQLLEADLSGRFTSSEKPFNEDDQNINDLMRSYIPIFIGGLHCRDGDHIELKNDARKYFLARLEGIDADDEQVPIEFSPPVRQWLIRTLMRVFGTEDYVIDILSSFISLVDIEDNVLTQMVMVAEVVRRLEQKEGTLPDKEIQLMSTLFIKKLDDFTPSGSTIATRGIQILGPEIEDPEQAMNKLCELLKEIQENYNPQEPGKCTAGNLADWEVLTDESVERKAIISAIKSVGGNTSVKISGAISLLRNEADRSWDDEELDTDVAVTAVLALGKFGRRLKGNGDLDHAKELDSILDTLAALAVTRNPTVANAAAKSLCTIMESEREATNRLLDLELKSEQEFNIDRMADAFRLADHRFAVDRLEQVKGEKKDRAQRLIKKIGGEHAFESLQQYQSKRERMDKLLGWAVMLSLGFTLLLAVFAALFPVLRGISPVSLELILYLTFISSAGFAFITFFASVFAAFPFKDAITPLRYLISGLLSFLFSFGMILTICLGFQYAAFKLQGSEIETLNFLAIKLYYAPLIEEGSDVLLASLTTPENSGFYAPLWVILLAVLGAAVLTISVLVKEVSERPSLGDSEELQRRVGKILQHQYYILFAPFGAVFVYQGLETAEMVQNDLTVGLAAFGAGLALNVLLQRAVDLAKNALYDGGDNGNNNATGEK